MIDPIDFEALYDEVVQIEASTVSEEMIRSSWASVTDFMHLARMTPVPQNVDHTVLVAWMSWAATRPAEMRPGRKKPVGPLVPGSIKVYLLGIKEKLARSGIQGVVDHPAVQRTLRKLKAANRNECRAKAITNDLLERIVQKIESQRFRDVRAKAMILMARASAMRCSEFLGTKVRDVAIDDNGVVITLWLSKTNKSGKPEYICVPRSTNKAMCAVSAVEAWLDRANLGPDDYLFPPLTPKRDAVSGGPLDINAYSAMIKALVKRAAEDPSKFSGYSARRGFATEAYRENLPLRWIGDRLRHEAGSPVTMRYIDDDDGFAGMGALL